MPILRKHRHRNYTIIYNIGLVDPRLSYGASGILAALMTKPDGWRINYRGLVHARPLHPDEREAGRKYRDGQNRVLGLLRELEEVGYLSRVRRQGDDGRIYWEVHLYEAPEDNPNYNGKNLQTWLNEVREAGISVKIGIAEYDGTKSKVELAEVVELDIGEEHAEEETELKEVYQFWHQNYGALTAYISEMLASYVEEVGADAVLAALQVGVKSGVRTLRYVEGVLRNKRSWSQAPSASATTSQQQEQQKELAELDSLNFDFDKPLWEIDE